jgi:dTDP-glucose 4,6-dehydratase
MPHPLTRDLEDVLEQTADLWTAFRGQRVFLTGGTGFVGTWLLETLLWADTRMSLGVNAAVLTRKPEAFRRKAPHIARHRAVRLIEGDVRSFDDLDGEFPYVVHAATEQQFTPDPNRPVAAFDDDLIGTRRVLEFARRHNTRRFLFTSSGAVYGKQPPELTHIREDYAGAPATTDTNSAYGQAKRVSEFFCSMYARQYGFDVLIARLFAFSGPYLPLDLNFAIGNFVRDVLAGGPVRIEGDGTPFRSYLYGADMAVWLWTILLNGESARPYNVGSPDALTIADLARAVVENTVPGTQIRIARDAVPGAPAVRYVPATSRAESELGLRSTIPVDEGIRRMYAWHRSSILA